jgi:ATP-binding cassette subfamily B protein
VKKGQRLAVIGRTGSGKSTLGQLLVRMYDPDEGKVLIDGKPARELNLHSLRKQLGYVPQDVFLFSDTVTENISFGTGDAVKADAEKAAARASVHYDILGFDNKYETMIGERGVTLSGGQKQRISIARALIKDHGLVIFDDCLSAVDARTETAIIITHRIFSLFHFDKIVVLEDGVIVESGSHDELLKLNGFYTDLYNRQLLEESENNNHKA